MMGTLCGVVAGLVGLACYVGVCRFVEYNRMAFSYFLKKLEFYQHGEGLCDVSALIGQLSQAAVTAFESMPRHKLEAFPKRKTAVVAVLVSTSTWLARLYALNSSSTTKSRLDIHVFML
jgi:hypothetical protein